MPIKGTRIPSIVVILLMLFYCSDIVAGNEQKVVVEITYEDRSHPPLKIETSWKEGLTALEALQFVAEVKTHPVGQYVFVSEINGIAGVPNKSVWYYEINGEPAKKIAIDQTIKNGDTITWVFKQDVCSTKKK